MLSIGYLNHTLNYPRCTGIAINGNVVSASNKKIRRENEYK